jgi:chromosome segregation ATPase
MSTPSPPAPDQIATLAFRISSLEQTVKDLQTQLHQYELARENDLKAQILRAEIDRVRADIADVKREQAEIEKKLIAQDLASQNQVASQRESQDKLQIRVLYGVVSTVVIIVSGVLIAFLTHHF